MSDSPHGPAGHRTEGDKSVKALRLLTMNTLFTGDVPARLRALGAALDRSDYDIVCLQEVMFRRNARLIRRAAPAYRHFAYSGTVLLKGGLVLLSRWPISRWRFVRYPMTGPVRGELLMRKGAQLASVATPDGELVVVNTHLSANRDDDWSPTNRYSRIAGAELARLTGLIAAVGPSLPVAVVGDLNIPRDSAALAGFVAAAGLRDILAGDTRPTYRPTPRWPSPPALDHVLVRAAAGETLTGGADFVFQDKVTLGDGRQAYLSDHYGVQARLIRSK
ncbi:MULTISPECIES: endonuclease/exonuclease/phosphatase family protein [unclassified Streptomyces]|uniref:endonuclease/exonuclease/phosphatase family protein n=1 Tax=unclassified Streptomyces TaxID=2593676 RepID=UPI00225764B5|nr:MULTISPECIES: endonuclease/exonuclease/phosphatase family protein [unclassified Streptomyces]MCX4993306.1 endonuclease/exonuclease/phosphatase family protein [Streptomyces sp. NBC_00568]MCX5009262.1 endonuclease/exonuclease/phosphatase family protein [Streptomyces sp. NBC_00638]